MSKLGIGLGVNVAGAGFSMFDDIGAKPTELKQAIDAVNQREMQSVIEQARSDALNVVTGLLETVSNNEYEADELPTDVLDGLIMEATDNSDDPDDTDDTYFDLLSGGISDALESLGVDESVISDMFGDDLDVANSAVETAVDTAIANLPDAGDDLDNFVRDFVFGEEDSEEVAGFDSIGKKIKAQNGAMRVRKVGGRKIAYRGTVAIRQGKKTIVNKRIGNQKIRLSAKQKGAIKKARLKAFTANAIKSRVKSLKKGHRLGVYKV